MGTEAAIKFWDSRPANPSCDGVKNSDQDSNYFKYGSKIYKQIDGVGIGVKLSTPYACQWEIWEMRHLK